MMTSSRDLLQFSHHGRIGPAAAAMLLAAGLLAASSPAATLEVGPGKPFRGSNRPTLRLAPAT